MKIIYIDCSLGISAEGLIAALAGMDSCRQIIEEAVHYYSAGAVRVEFVEVNAGLIKATAATLKVGNVSTSGAVKILEESTQKWSSRGGIWSLAAQAANKFKSAVLCLNHPLSEGELLYFTGAAAGFFAALNALEAGEIYATPIPVSKNPNADKAQEYLFWKCCCGAQVEQKTECVHTQPAGAALLAAAAAFCAAPPFTAEKASCGALLPGKNDGVVMAVLGKKSAQQEQEEVFVIETSIDDMNPEFFPHACEEIFQAGALDVFLTPIYMKKGRPGVLLTVLCKCAQKDEVIKRIFKQTSTLGVRITRQQRRVLQRKWVEVKTPYGKIRVKLGYFNEGGPAVQVAPEYEDCRRAALECGVPVKEVYREALICAQHMLDKKT